MGRVVVFPDGTRVSAGALVAPRVEDPDFGLYVYGSRERRATPWGRVVNRVARRTLVAASWTPAWESDWLDWPDFGVPADAARAAQSIVHAFERARRGERVEVRCFGGRGRTGTILACMAVLAGVPRDGAVAWVRREYLRGAVERGVQRDWVGWFASRAKAGPHAEKPPSV